MIHYFAYGSNLHPLRLLERVPSANLVGPVQQSRHRLAFHKRGQDGSGKCNLFSTGSGSDLVYGALYTLDPEHKNALDRCEGLGCGYMENRITVQYQGRDYPCFTYIAEQSHIVDSLKPFHWYKQLVILGAKYLRFPDPYISAIEGVGSVDDPDAGRKKQGEALIAKITTYRTGIPGPGSSL